MRPRRRAAFSFLATLAYAVLFGLMYLSLRLPYFGQANARYGLVVMPILALFFAEGLTWLDAALAQRGWLPARAIVYDEVSRGDRSFAGSSAASGRSQDPPR